MTLFFQQFGVWEAPAKVTRSGRPSIFRPAPRWGHLIHDWTTPLQMVYDAGE